MFTFVFARLEGVVGLGVAEDVVANALESIFGQVPRGGQHEVSAEHVGLIDRCPQFDLGVEKATKLAARDCETSTMRALAGSQCTFEPYVSNTKRAYSSNLSTISEPSHPPKASSKIWGWSK